jgi:hypothetical protein
MQLAGENGNQFHAKPLRRSDRVKTPGDNFSLVRHTEGTNRIGALVESHVDLSFGVLGSVSHKFVDY